jgi:Fe-S cluster biogenesis protein NfuA
MSVLPQYQPDPKASDQEKMRGLIEFLSAYIEQYHGGYARYVDYQGKILTVEMGGACANCTLSVSTLHGWIEGTARQFFPELEGVRGILVEDKLAAS